MPIRSLESFLNENSAIVPFPTEILRHVRLGIDVDHYVHKQAYAKRFPYLEATGGVPQPLLSQLELDLALFREHQITPTFVFSGLRVNATQRANGGLAPSTEKFRADAWNRYYIGASNPQSEIVESFHEPGAPTPLDPFFLDLVGFFQAHNVQYMVAPYLAWLQLAYLHQEEYLDAVYGPTELLLSSMEKVILNLDAKEFRFVDKVQLFTDFRLSQSQFNQIAAIVGYENQTPLPFLPPATLVSPIRHCLDLLYSGVDLHQYVLSTDPRLAQAFEMALLAIQLAPVLKLDGLVQLSVDEPIPNDVHEIISQRLPSEILLYQRYGLIRPLVLESVVAGKQDVRPPLAGGSTKSYRQLLAGTVTLVDKQFAMLTGLLARYYQFKKIPWSLWYEDRSKAAALNNRLTPAIYLQTRHLYVHTLEPEFALSAFMTSFDSAFVARNTNRERVAVEDRLASRNDVISTATLRALMLMEYIRKDNTVTPWGVALAQAAQGLSGAALELMMYLLMFMKANVLKLHEQFTPRLQHFSETKKLKLLRVANPSFSVKPVEAEESLRVVTRVLSLCKTTMSQPVAYQGPISEALLAFRSHLEVIQQSVRTTVEVAVVALLCNDEASVRLLFKDEDWVALSAQLPFGESVANTTMGAVFDLYVELVKCNEGNVKSSRDQLSVMCRSLPVQLSGIETCLFGEGVHFWNQFMKAVGGLKEAGLIEADYHATLVDADKWFQAML